MEKPKRTVAFHNLGCKVNYYETEAMKQSLAAHGYEIKDFNEVADVYVINTCSVTNIADRKSRQMIHRARKTNEKAVVVACGCYVQAVGSAVLSDTADIAVGNNMKGRLYEILEQYFSKEEPVRLFMDPEDLSGYEETPITAAQSRVREYVKIQDGCNQFCSYCIIPYTRGRIRSRGMEEIVSEAGSLVRRGTRELVLTGIHISSYGMDWEKPKDLAHPFNGEALLALLKLLSSLSGLERIRLSSLEPRIMTPDFVEKLSKIPKICPHFHLSLQSGSDGVLKRMNRHYTTGEYREIVKRLREAFPHPAITTDVITGFPGETEEEFLETVQFLTELSLYELHVFPYSKREKTRAAGMDGQLSEREKSERSRILLDLTKRQSKEYRASFLGLTVPVLWEEQEKYENGWLLAGFTPSYVRVVKRTERNDDSALNTSEQVSITGFWDEERLAGG